MKKIIHKAESRGYFDYGWLRTNHSFSFGKYYEPQRLNFGALRVLNDDVVIGGKGFGKHPHDNMEIISIPLSGSLAHEDNAGNKQLLKENEVQVMSAGSGIVHSEYNSSNTNEVNFLQIWIFPDADDYEARYDQKSFIPEDRENKIHTFISPNKNGDNLWINQDAYLSRVTLGKDSSIIYKVKNPEKNGVYVFLIEGALFIDEEPMKNRDALGLWDTEQINIDAVANSEILLIEVPMS